MVCVLSARGGFRGNRAEGGRPPFWQKSLHQISNPPLDKLSFLGIWDRPSLQGGGVARHRHQNFS